MNGDAELKYASLDEAFRPTKYIFRGVTECKNPPKLRAPGNQGLREPTSTNGPRRTARQRIGGAFSLLLTGVADVWTSVRHGERRRAATRSGSRSWCSPPRRSR